MSKSLSRIVGVSVLALAGTAKAGAPLALTNAQMDIVTAGASSSNSSEYSKNSTSASYNEVKSGGKLKICDDSGKERKSKSYSKNLKEISYDYMNPSGKPKMYDNFTKKGLSQWGLLASASSGRMFAPKAK